MNSSIVFCCFFFDIPITVVWKKPSVSLLCPMNGRVPFYILFFFSSWFASNSIFSKCCVFRTSQFGAISLLCIHTEWKFNPCSSTNQSDVPHLWSSAGVAEAVPVQRLFSVVSLAVSYRVWIWNLFRVPAITLLLLVLQRSLIFQINNCSNLHKSTKIGTHVE